MRHNAFLFIMWCDILENHTENVLKQHRKNYNLCIYDIFFYLCTYTDMKQTLMQRDTMSYKKGTRKKCYFLLH